MINELNQLSLAIQNAKIETESWHSKYGEIPNTPCIRIVFGCNHVSTIENVSSDKRNHIRKYGDNQGSFPAMNLACLYRVSDEKIIKRIKQIRADAQRSVDIEEIRSFCTQNNWTSKNFISKFQRCLIDRPNEIRELLNPIGYGPLDNLINSIVPFTDHLFLHEELCRIVFKMIEEKKDVGLALDLLFFVNNSEAEKFGSLSIVLDSIDLEQQDLSTIGLNFTRGLNRALLLADNKKQKSAKNCGIDAFGEFFSPTNESMPKIKLPAGFVVSLRTMFHEQKSQYRYGKIENDTYPLSKMKINRIKDAFEYISSKELKNKTWIITGKDQENKPDEVLFIYPYHFSDDIPGIVGIFAQTYIDDTRQSDFQEQSKIFAEYITKTKEYDPKEYPDNIQIFIIKKLDKARSKVIYSRISSPDEIIYQSDKWQKAAKNIPFFYGGAFRIPFPLDIAEIMNQIWKQNGELSSDKFKSVKSYHGLELLFGLSENELNFDLQILLRNSQKLALYSGRYFNTKEHPDDKKIINKTKTTIMLMGMILFWLDHRKEKYMNEYPYLLGQLLKVSDNLHELYCYKVRDGKIPSQLVGGSLYMSASEFPKQAISQLSQRVMPYLNWARTHQNDKIEKNDDSDPRYFEPTAGYYLNQYRKISDKLLMVMSETTRFTDTEKACLFLGYLASFPKSQKDDGSEKENEE